VVAASVALGMAACGESHRENRVTPTALQVGAAAEATVHEAASAAGVVSHLAAVDTPDVRPTHCLSSDEAARHGLVQVNRLYAMRGIPHPTQVTAIETMRHYWPAYGWSISSEKSIGQLETMIVAVHPADHLDLTLDTGVGGITINVQSGCVEPDAGSSANSASTEGITPRCLLPA
jgi:hypothetical protein